MSADVKDIPILEVAAYLGITIQRNNKSYCINGHDTKPSLTFYPHSNSFYCFGCGIGGSVIDLVRECLNVSTGEAIRWIETQFGVADTIRRNKTAYTGSLARGGYPTPTYPNKTPYKASKSVSEALSGPVTGLLYSDIYAAFLSALSDYDAVEYLERRGIPQEITRTAGIKALPRRPSADFARVLVLHFGSKRVLESGLITPSGTLALSQHRLIVPFYDECNRVVNLQGRAIDDDTEPKYKLLPGIKTTLYNMQTLSDVPHTSQVYVCEGAIDALSLQVFGLTPVVALTGVNNLKDDIVSILALFDCVYLGDADEAGEAGFVKLKRALARFGARLRLFKLKEFAQRCGVTGYVKDVNDILQAVHNGQTRI